MVGHVEYGIVYRIDTEESGVQRTSTNRTLVSVSCTKYIRIRHVRILYSNSPEVEFRRRCG